MWSISEAVILAILAIANTVVKWLYERWKSTHNFAVRQVEKRKK